MMLPLARWFCLVSLLCLVSACSGSGGGDATVDAGGGNPTCGSEAVCERTTALVAQENITAYAGQTVVLDGASSTGSNALTYEWTQTGGATVTLANLTVPQHRSLHPQSAPKMCCDFD